MVGICKAEALPDDIANNEIHYALVLPSASASAISTDFVLLLQPIYKPFSRQKTNSLKTPEFPKSDPFSYTSTVYTGHTLDSTNRETLWPNCHTIGSIKLSHVHAQFAYYFNALS